MITIWSNEQPNGKILFPTKRNQDSYREITSSGNADDLETSILE